MIPTNGLTQNGDARRWFCRLPQVSSNAIPRTPDAQQFFSFTLFPDEDENLQLKIGPTLEYSCQEGLSLESLEINGCSSLYSFLVDKLPATLRTKDSKFYEIEVSRCLRLMSFPEGVLPPSLSALHSNDPSNGTVNNQDALLEPHTSVDATQSAT
ncbi:hypothetical protein QYF36_022149 [Acer negundo]|nr:hypothetical protein QYF36_022149 [Acer negundo]